MSRRQTWSLMIAAALVLALGIELGRLLPLADQPAVLGRGDAAARAGTAAGLARRVARLEQDNAQLQLQMAALGRATSDSARIQAGRGVFLRPVDQYPVPTEVRFCGEVLPLRDVDVHARFTSELYRLLTNRHWVLSWQQRSEAVFPIVEQRLRAAELPDDLKYIMVIESALDPRAVSSAEAVGYWQFIEPTGNRYGLRRDLVVDERRDLVRATDAAIAYLKDLYGELRSWPLALSAYNAGEQRIRDAVADQGTRDFYSMVLPRETESYWFRAAAVKLLFEDPATYDLPQSTGAETVVVCDTLLLRVGDRLPLRQLAEASGISYRRLHQLNPRYLRTWLPPGEHRIAVPHASVEGLLAAFPRAQLVARGSAPAPATQQLAEQEARKPSATGPAAPLDAAPRSPGGGSPR